MIPLLFYQLQEGRMTMTVRELLVSKQIPMRDVDFIAIVSDDGVVLNSADQQSVWFGMHQLSEKFMDKEIATFSVTECDDVFSRWESGPLKNHTFEDVLIASENGNQLFSSMSLGDVVLYLVLNESSDGERVSLPMAVNSIAL